MGSWSTRAYIKKKEDTLFLTRGELFLLLVFFFCVKYPYGGRTHLLETPVARATKEDCGPVGLTKLQSRERLLLLLLLLLLVILLWLLWLLRLPLLRLLSLDDAGDTTSGCMTDWANISARSACSQPESIVKARSGKRIRWSTWSKLSQHWMDHGELDGLDGSSLRSSWPRVTWPCPMPNPMPTLIFSHVIRSVSQSVGNSTRGAHDMLWHSNSLKKSSENKQVQVRKAQEFFFKIKKIQKSNLPMRNEGSGTSTWIEIARQTEHNNPPLTVSRVVHTPLYSPS